MGNAVGGLQDYWTAIESTNFFCGGAIWDWIDQAMYNYLPDGRRYLAYGGDFGDTPNDGMFVMNGILFADRTPKPQLHEVKKVYQNIGITSEGIKEGKLQIKLFNKNYFDKLRASDYQLSMLLLEDGKPVALDMGTMIPTIAPRSSAVVSFNYNSLLDKALDPAKEYHVNVYLMQANAKPWAERGYKQAEEQLLLQSAERLPSLASVATQGKALRLNLPKAKDADRLTLEGEGFKVVFDNKQGTIHSLNYGGKTLIAEGQGPKLDAFRAASDNDNWAYAAWGANGLHNLKHRVLSSRVDNRKDGAVSLFYLVESQAPNAAKIGRKNRWASESSGKYYIEENTTKPFGSEDFKFTTAQTWTVYPDGSIELQANIVSNKLNLALGRLGYEVIVPKEYGEYTYYGRGPWNNYSDRKTSQFVGIHKSTVQGQFVNFPKPQTMGNREDVRWLTLTNQEGKGLLVQAGDVMSASALPWSAKELLLAPHPHELPEPGDTHLHLDASVTGLGGNSCGQGAPLKHCRSYARGKHFSIVIRPYNKDKADIQRYALTSDVAPIIARNPQGVVSITAREGDVILFQMGKKGKVQVYKTPFLHPDSVEITTWTQANPLDKVTQQFGKAKEIALDILYVSSEEVGRYDATNLLDNDPETMWHTMYSVTVAQYPHWIDFDAGKEKTVKGFAYTPRTDGFYSGDIKDFALSTSSNGKDWTEVYRGKFNTNKGRKVVTLEQPLKARYIRFTALSSHDGTDVASGAEFSLIAE